MVLWCKCRLSLSPFSLQLLKAMLQKSVDYICSIDNEFVVHELHADAVDDPSERSLIKRKRAVVQLPSSDRLVYLEPQIMLLTKKTACGLLSFEVSSVLWNQRSRGRG